MAFRQSTGDFAKREKYLVLFGGVAYNRKLQKRRATVPSEGATRAVSARENDEERR